MIAWILLVTWFRQPLALTSHLVADSSLYSSCIALMLVYFCTPLSSIRIPYASSRARITLRCPKLSQPWSLYMAESIDSDVGEQPSAFATRSKGCGNPVREFMKSLAVSEPQHRSCRWHCGAGSRLQLRFSAANETEGVLKGVLECVLRLRCQRIRRRNTGRLLS